MFIMKRTLFILAAVAALCFPASAQQKGEQSLGFFFGYDTGITEYTLNLRSGFPATQTITANNGHNLMAAVEYSYFVADNLRLSATLSYGFQGDSETPSIAHTINIAPGLAYYVRLAPNFYYTPNMSFGFAASLTGSGILSKDWELISLTGLGAELQPLAVEFRPTEKFAMSVSIFSIQGVAMQGKFDFTGGNDFNISGMGLALDCLMNPQIGFKRYF